MPAPRGEMAVLKLKYIKEYTDRHGVVRRYFRKGAVKGLLPGAVGSAEFMEAYQTLLGGKQEIRSHKKAGTFGRLVTDFYGSVEFANLKDSSKSHYKKVLEPLVKQYGERPGATMDQDAVRKILQKIGVKSPGMSNLTRSILRLLMNYAISAKWRKDNPVIGLPRYKLGTHHTWTDVELSTFEARWPLGTRERLGYALLLYTGQRVGDVMKMTRADIIDGAIHVIQQKTDADLMIPIAPELKEAMKAGPTCINYLIADARGRRMNKDALTHLIRRAVADAGLDARCKAHGLRKAALRRLAEAGSSTKQISAVSGHKSLKEIERYTDAANQAGLARSAMKKLKKRT